MTDKALKPIITQYKRQQYKRLKTYKKVKYGENTFEASANFGRGADASLLYITNITQKELGNKIGVSATTKEK